MLLSFTLHPLRQGKMGMVEPFLFQWGRELQIAHHMSVANAINGVY
jgi:hypothetical protein